MPETTTPARVYHIRDMIRPDVERPLPALHTPDRRQHPRYSRCLLGELTTATSDATLPIACVDVSMGGAQVVTPAQIDLNGGDRVRVHIDHGPNVYEDDFTVVATRRMPTGTAIHLRC